jgi:8-oxo-dGTP diphosphatase
VEPVRLTGVYKNMNRGIVALVFLCKVTGGQLTTSSETDAFRWAAEDEVRELTSEAFAVRVTDARNDRSATMRVMSATRKDNAA